MDQNQCHQYITMLIKGEEVKSVWNSFMIQIAVFVLGYTKIVDNKCSGSTWSGLEGYLLNP